MHGQQNIKILCLVLCAIPDQCQFRAGLFN